MKARYFGAIFVAAVLVPSILLSVLSVRAAGREEAYVEKQLTATLLAEVTHTAGLVSTGVAGIAGDLHASVALPAGSGYGKALLAWKKQNALVDVPFLLSSSYAILWPRTGAASEDRAFLEQNADFLSGKAPTEIYANIAVVHKKEVLAEASAGSRAEPQSVSAAGASVPAAPADSSAVESQQALDTFAQSAAVQEKVYEEARQQGERLTARVVSPTSKALPEAVGAGTDDLKAGSAGKDKEVTPSEAPARKRDAALRQDAVVDQSRASSEVPQPAASQYVITSRLLSQIASRGEYGIIPRFTMEKLTFIFWNRQEDGRIVGCEIAAAPFRQRLAAVLPSTYSPVRILTVLDEKGEPLAAPPGQTGRDWRRPFVSQEIGESLPRWEVASYLTDPGSISAQARSASVVIWILVLILFVSVAGGGTMVLTSVYGEMRLAQKKAGFVANVSHELKTPLTSISLFVDLLRRGKRQDPEKRDRYLALMAAETERLGKLINNVLDFSSLEKGRKKYSLRVVDLAQVAGQVVEGQRVRLESLGFSVRFTGAPGFVKADPEALKQVLINLLSNAEKYSPQAREIDVEVVRAGGDAAAHVRDRGIGVAAKDRERIFQEFVRVDDSLIARVPGTGLGLTIARRIARDLGGELSCQGREAGGSDFVLRLPAVTEDQQGRDE